MFKEYQDKNSLRKMYSRQLQGGTTDVKGDRLGWWERRSDIQPAPDDIRVEITRQWQLRPDLVASFYYGTTDLEWLVLQFNNIVDINEEFIVGKIIYIPSASRALSAIATKSAYSRSV